MTEVEKSRLDELAQEINEEHHAFRRGFKATYRSALRAGDLLTEAKAEAGHGNWTAWVEENCEFSMRTAQVYMRIANNRGAVEETIKSAEPAYLSIEGVLTRIAAPTGGLTRERGEGITRVGASLSEEHTEPRESGVLEQIQATPGGLEAFAEVNHEFEEEGLYLKMRSRIQDLYWMGRQMTPEEAAKREFAHHAADIARDTVIGRRRLRNVRSDMLTDEPEAVREWLGDYIQKLKDAEARLYEQKEAPQEIENEADADDWFRENSEFYNQKRYQPPST
jgi:hypothetical protein